MAKMKSGGMEFTPAGMAARVIATILIIAVFLAGSLLYVAFYSTGYGIFQKIVIVLVALIVAVALISILWVAWAMSMKNQFWKR
jgi:hypothetical protein